MKALSSLLCQANRPNYSALMAFMGVLGVALSICADDCTVCHHENRADTNDPTYTCIGMPQCDTTFDSFYCSRCNTVSLYTCTKPGYPDKVKRDYDCFNGDGCG